MLSFVIAAPLILSLLSGSASATSCNATTPCPSSAPCCSEFGFCGTDSFCLGGCNPMASYSLDSCKPNPVCKSMTHTFKDTSRILSNSTYFNGNASEYDWVLDKGAIFSTSSNGGELVMTLTKDNGGTRISSTRYLHYGTVTARMKVSRWNGVVTAFISMSDVKDEIDWEFPGDTTSEGQTNFFWQGYIPTGANNGGIEKGLSDTFANYHDFTIDWQPKTLNFLIDGKVVRSVKQSDQVANGVSRYPNTPSRIQLSLWPAGIEGSPQGTIQWAGGMINWNDPDYASAGHFYALVNKITVKCADPQAPSADITSYKYGTNTSANTPNVFFSNQTTLLNNAPPTLATALTKRSAWALAAAGTLASFFL